MQNKLVAMSHGAHVHLSSYSFWSHWEITVESSDEAMQFKIKDRGDTPEEAINTAYEKWRKITGALPEFIGLLPPPPLAPDAQEGDHFIDPDNGDEVRVDVPLDDDIPF